MGCMLARTVGPLVFLRGLFDTLTEAQAAEFACFCEGSVFFQSPPVGLQGTAAKMGRMGVGGGNDDSAIIRWQVPVMARISGPRRASASAHPLFRARAIAYVEELEKE